MHLSLLTLALLAPMAAPSLANGGADTAVVVPQEFLPALAPWIEHRQRQGHQLAFITEWDSGEQIREALRELVEQGPLQYVLLIGDAPSLVGAQEQAVPTHLAKATVNVHWGSEPEIATDNWYGDLDDDGIPELAVGRLTADTPDELSTMIVKILSYEQRAQRGLWQRRFNFVAGVGGFGALADSVIETTTKKFLTEGIPASYCVSMTYGNWRSPYCPDPRRFRETVLDRFNEGCLFWVYMGHGQRTVLDRVLVPGGAFPIMDTDDIPELRPQGAFPIAVFLSCYAGAFDGVQDCLAEELLRSPDGAVAVLAGSRITMPYAMGVMGHELLDQYFEGRPQTLGQLVLLSKHQLAAEGETEGGHANRKLLDTVATALSPSRELLADERREHVLLFNLLGDPLTRIRHAGTVRVLAPTEGHAGEVIRIQCDNLVAGEGVIELVCRRDRMKSLTPRRTRFEPTDAHLASYSATYLSANDRRWALQNVDFPAGTFDTTIAIPADAHGACFVRVFVDGSDGHAVGASNLMVRRAPTAASTNAAKNAPAAPSSRN